MTRLIVRVFGIAVVAACPLLASSDSHASAPSSPQAPVMPAGISRQQLMDNPTTMVARLTMKPGAREEPHTHPFDAVVVQLTEGVVEFAVGAESTMARREPGYVWFIPRNTPHASANVGRYNFDVVTVAIK